MRRLVVIWRSSRLRYAFLIGAFIGLLLVLLWRGEYFMGLRLRLNDIYYAPLATQDQIVIIAIDDASLQRYGRTPAEWSRTVYVDLANRMRSMRARVLAIDLLFSEVEPEDEEFAAALLQLRQNDARTRIVLAAAGVQIQPSIRSAEGELLFSTNLSLSPVLAERADYLGYVNALPDIDGVIRRQPSLIRIGDQSHLSFSLAVYLAYLRIPPAATDQVISRQGQTLKLPGDRRISVDEYGMWQPNYFGPPAGEAPETFRFVSLVDVLDGAIESSVFDDKIVLIGLMNTTGLLDQYQVPSATAGTLMAGVEIQANAIESVLQNIFLAPVSDAAQALAIFLLAIGASLIYAFPRWYLKILLAIGLTLVWLIFTSVHFSLSNTYLSLYDTLLAILLPVLPSIGIDITLETRQRQQKEFLLNSLLRIAEQHLQLPQAAEYILEDVAKIIPNIPVMLYVRESAAVMSWRRFGKPGMLWLSSDTSDLGDPAEITLKRNVRTTVIPLRWQGKQQGMIMLQHPQQTQLDHATLKLLYDFAEQLAPHIDNMLLHEEVQRQKTLFDAVFSESPAGVAVVDTFGRIVQCNQDLALLLNSSPEELEQQLLPDLLASRAGNTALADRLKSAIKADAKFLIDEVTLGETSVRIGMAPLRAYHLWTVIVVDITALVELGKLKTQMLRMASHDLKNPLSRIMGFTELLQMSSGLDVQQRRFLDFVANDAKAMLDIINDILNIERLRSNRVFRENTNLNLLVQEVCSRHQPDLLQKRHQFTLHLPDTAIQAYVDAGQLSQAISNLIGNAIKYTQEDGQICVRLSIEDQHIRFEVKDNGYGIPKEAQLKVFEEFYRVKSLKTAQIGGTGLGLSLVKRIVEAHQGEVGLISEEGQGSTFYFTIPISETGSDGSP